jgi:hypothetical protein
MPKFLQRKWHQNPTDSSNATAAEVLEGDLVGEFDGEVAGAMKGDEEGVGDWWLSWWQTEKVAIFTVLLGQLLVIYDTSTTVLSIVGCAVMAATERCHQERCHPKTDEVMAILVHFFECPCVSWFLKYFLACSRRDVDGKKFWQLSHFRARDNK